MLYTILIVVLVLALLGGVGPWSPGGMGYGLGPIGIGLPGIVLLVLILLLVTGRL